MAIANPRAFQDTLLPQDPIRTHVIRRKLLAFALIQTPIDGVTACITGGGETFALEGPTPGERITTNTAAEVVR